MPNSGFSKQVQNLNWVDILNATATLAENRFNTHLIIDYAIVDEIKPNIEKTLRGFNKEEPNLAKIAGCTTFWIRQLKPVFIDPTYHTLLNNSPQDREQYLAINEWIALWTGIAICDVKNTPTKDLTSSPLLTFSALTDRVFHDWVISLRQNAHSPHGTVVAFELFLASQVRHA
jgi:hypothetical protein